PHQRMDARQARSWGLGDGVLTDENDSSALYQRWKDASRTATRFAMELADRNGRGGGLTPRQSRLMERASFSLLFAGDDPREGIAAFFDHKRPRFSSNT
ncbi:MAG: hypothetical protein ACE5HU_04460, partial [Acidobacteriota bacterium]